MQQDARALLAWRLIRYSYGAVVFFLAGLDKVLGTNLIVYWPQYISPVAVSLLPVSVAIGVIEIVVGAFAFTRYTTLSSYISAAWLVTIALNLVLAGYLDIAIRDLLLAAGSVAAAQLSYVFGYSLAGYRREGYRRRVAAHRPQAA